MNLRRVSSSAAVLVAAVAGLQGSCARRPTAEVNPIEPAFAINRPRAPLGSAVEITYTWKADAQAKKLTQDYRALVHFLDSHNVMLFDDDHVPEPPPAGWEPGKTYSYTRTKFIPIYPYVGPVEVRMGLYPASGKGDRVMLKGTDAGMREFTVSKIELLPQTENIFLVYKEGWHGPEVSPQNPSLERTWTKKEALVSFKNPKRDVVLYLEADTNYKAFTKQPPVLTLSVGSGAGLQLPVESSEVFLKKVKFKAEQLGQEEWVDLRLAMNDSFVPKDLKINDDDRELGLLVYHLYVGEADKLGEVPAGTVVDAATLPAATASAGKPAPRPAPGAKATTAATAKK
jgi:hypothetical protein